MLKENRNKIDGVDPKTWGAFDKGMDQTTKILQKVIPIIGIGTLLAACDTLPSQPTSEPGETSPLPGINTETLTSTEGVNYELTPTVENPATQELTLVPETETPAPSPTPVYEVGAAGGEYSNAQKELINSPSAIKQIARIQRWLDYWIKFVNRPFAQDSKELNWFPIFDNVQEPTEVGIFLYAGGEYGGKIFTSPLGNGVFAEFPPEYDGGEIETGFGPLELTSGEEGLWLSVQDGIPVRRDAKGQIDEKLDMVKGVWIKVEKYPIDLEKLRNFPQSYEYLVAHPEEFVEAPNPLENIDVFNQWWNEKFIPILGDRSEREKNMIMRGGGVLGDNYDIGNYSDPKPVQGQPEMLFFKNEGVTYPIAIINVGYEQDPHANYTMAIILVYENVLGERGNLITLANGENIKMLRIYLKKNPDYPGISDDLMDIGIKGDFSEEDKLIFGSGVIVTTP